MMPFVMGELMRFAFVIVACGLGVAGCARFGGRVETAYVPPSGYQSHTCEQLTEEASDVSSRLVKATGQDYTGDKVAVAVGRVVFFPILVFEKDNYADPFEVARLKRSLEAIEQASIQKNCGLTFHHALPPRQMLSNDTGAVY